MVNSPETHAERRLVELTQVQLATDPALVEGLIARDAVHQPGKATGRSAEDDLFQRVAPDTASASNARKRGFALYCGDEKLPRHVVYAYMDKVPESEDRIAPEHYPANMAKILLDNEKATEAPNIAVCYGITNWDLREPKEKKRQPEVKAGELLERGYAELQKMASVKDVVTLSPAPNMEDWLAQKVADGDSSMLDAAFQETLKQLAPGAASPIEAFQHLYQDDAYAQMKGNELAAFNGIMEAVGRYYLLEGSQLDNKSDGFTHKPPRAFDGVERFHMGNGAQLAKVTAQRQTDNDAILVTHPHDKSQNKLNVSYHYVPEREREANAESLKHQGFRAATPEIRAEHTAYLGRLVDAPMRDMTPQNAQAAL
jgi:hypothetical protein